MTRTSGAPIARAFGPSRAGQGGRLLSAGLALVCLLATLVQAIVPSWHAATCVHVAASARPASPELSVAGDDVADCALCPIAATLKVADRCSDEAPSAVRGEAPVDRIDSPPSHRPLDGLERGATRPRAPPVA